MTVMDLRSGATAPDRSLAQRLDALAQGNRVRTLRAQMKKDLKAGRRSVLDVLEAPPWYAETMSVRDLVLSTPKVGRVKANKVLLQARVSPTKTLGGATVRQRRELRDVLLRSPSMRDGALLS